MAQRRRQQFFAGVVGQGVDVLALVERAAGRRQRAVEIEGDVEARRIDESAIGSVDFGAKATMPVPGVQSGRGIPMDYAEILALRHGALKERDLVDIGFNRVTPDLPKGFIQRRV